MKNLTAFWKIRRIAAFVLAAILCLVLCSCAHGTKEPGGKEEESPAEQTEKEGVPFNGDTLHLENTANLKDYCYKVDAEKMHSETVFALRNITIRQEDEVVLEIRLYYFENETVDKVLEETDAPMTDKNLNGIDYKYFETDFEYDGEKVPGHNYVCFFDGTTYSISFISAYDTTALEAAFMDTAHFSKE